MKATLIKFFNFFNCALVENDNKVDFSVLNNYAMQRGFIVHPDVCNTSVRDFLDSVTVNYNATFYKKWSDITEKTRTEILFDQLLHYATTYGTEFSLGNGYVPNDGKTEDVPEFSDFKVILPISVEELSTRCLDVLKSGIALKQETMTDLADFLVENCDNNVLAGSIDYIKNREALVYICAKTGLYPREKFNLFRYIIYVTTGDTMIVNNDEMFQAIANSTHPFNFTTLDENTLQTLSSIFLRYKELFIAFKHCLSENAPVINKLRKLAVKNHQPCQIGFWNTVFSVQHAKSELEKHISELTPFKMVALMQTCLDRMNPMDNQFYLIRNQKCFIRENYKTNASTEYLTMLYTVLRLSLVECLKKNSQKRIVKIVDGEEVETFEPVTVKTVSGLHVSLPTSEKSFIGNYPFGTSFEMTENNHIGCYWRNEWGTRDYDLSLRDYSDRKYGWNSEWRSHDNDIVFSGDMTNADPEATEVLLIRRNCPKGIIKVNQFSTTGYNRDEYQFRMFFGQQDIQNLHENFMVDPNSIKLNVDVTHTMREVTVGVTNGKSVVLMAVNTGNSIVAGRNKYSQIMMDCIMHKSECFVDARELLVEAGFNVVDESFTGKSDVDFANLDKDSLIALMK